jgi:transcriptional regulator with XRE-family HTH domain
MSRISSSLKTARHLRGLEQRELARQCGVSQPWISYLERGKVSPSRALKCRIARVLGLPAAVLFPEDGDD